MHAAKSIKVSQILQQRYALLPGAILILKQDDENQEGRETADPSVSGETLSLLFASDAALSLFSCSDPESLASLLSGLCPLILSAVSSSGRGTLHLDAGSRSFLRVPATLFLRKGQDPDLGELLFCLVEEDREGKLEEQDHLTGLLSRQSFLALAENRFRTPFHVPFSYVYINLSHFRRYNRREGLRAGDVLLKSVADVLTATCSDALVSRFEADHFVLCLPSEGLNALLDTVREKIRALRPETEIDIKAGIYQVSCDADNIPVNSATDLAMSACDSIRSIPSRYCALYDDALRRQMEQKEYIVENIDRAIRDGSIKVYYQPVVRTVPKTLCGFEALTRWVDPVYGFTNPGVFIPVLEQSRLIHHLDTYVVDQVCQRIHEQLTDTGHAVPISFNLSRLDYMLCDVFQIIEDSVKKYDIPRDLVRIEVTESTVMMDRQHILEEIDRFRSAGYQVWMDDFGSGYSSLNMLKDFHFDELKIDMEFLRTFTKRSREIIASTVRMAKRLGIHTLAEGVETKEQVEFLRSIGCEKMQGFYFGRPAPFEDSMRHCLEEDGLSPETREWNACFDRLGMVNFQTEKPLLLVDLSSAGSLYLLYSNAPSDDLVRSLGFASPEAFLSHLQDPANPQHRRIRLCLEDLAAGMTAGENRPPHTRYVTENGHYIGAAFQEVYTTRGHSAFEVFLSDLTGEETFSRSPRNDAILRDLLTSFDNILLLHLPQDYIETRYQSPFFSAVPGTHYEGIEKTLRDFAASGIHSADQKRFLKTFDPKTLEERIIGSESGSVSGQFRFAEGTKGHVWKLFVAIRSTSHEGVVLITMRDSILVSDTEAAMVYGQRFDTQERSAKMPGFEDVEANARFASIFYALTNVLPVPLFWKDTNRRFLGISREAKKELGLEDVDVVGHTFEEIGDVLDSGEADFKEVQSLCGKPMPPFSCNILKDGAPHHFEVQEIPFLEHGKIAGLVGYFRDLDAAPDSRLLTTDPVTGLSGSRGVLEAVMNYSDGLALYKEGYDIILLRVSSFIRESASYGTAFGSQLLAWIGQTILESAGPDCFVGRLSGPVFVVLRQQRPGMESLVDLENRVRAAVEDIHVVEHSDVTLRVMVKSDSVTSKEGGQGMARVLKLVGAFYEEKTADKPES